MTWWQKSSRKIVENEAFDCQDISKPESVFGNFGLPSFRHKVQYPRLFYWTVLLKMELLIEPLMEEFMEVVLEIFQIEDRGL